MDIDPESLIPKLPSPKDLRPFPTKLSITFKGHNGRIRVVAFDPTGQWIASGSDDLTLKIWEVATGRCVKTLSFDEPIMSIQWNPNKALSLLAVATYDSLIFLFNILYIVNAKFCLLDLKLLMMILLMLLVKSSRKL